MKKDKLINIGFTEVGAWEMNGRNISYSILPSALKETNVLYGFIWQDEVMYVGKTIQPLHKRMYGYQNPGKSQPTNSYVNKQIKKALKQRGVEIYALPDNKLLYWGDFHVNLAGGLEDSIIQELQPAWNRIKGAVK